MTKNQINKVREDLQKYGMKMVTSLEVECLLMYVDELRNALNDCCYKFQILEDKYKDLLK